MNDLTNVGMTVCRNLFEKARLIIIIIIIIIARSGTVLKRETGSESIQIYSITPFKYVNSTRRIVVLYCIVSYRIVLYDCFPMLGFAKDYIYCLGVSSPSSGSSPVSSTACEVELP